MHLLQVSVFLLRCCMPNTEGHCEGKPARWSVCQVRAGLYQCTPSDWVPGCVQDAMETAAQSGDPEIAEELLRFYVEQNERECFAAALFTCYDLIRPDIAVEVSPPNAIATPALAAHAMCSVV